MIREQRTDRACRSHARNSFFRSTLITALLVSFIPALSFAQSVGLPRFPSVSPDGSEPAFSWGGDIWRVDAEGGQAVRLTRHNLDDLHSSWSPDGRRIAFASMRDGYMNIWRIGRVGREIIVTFERPVGEERLEYRALLTPVSYAELARLTYDAFREESRARVRELSDGRIGYIHIEAMNQSSLEEFQGDLYAAAYGKDGLIIDVRNNGGGHTTDRILTSIMAEEHAYTIPAGSIGRTALHTADQYAR